eukprot:5156460-Pleurochrysis_carterae.AAC.1
MALGGVARWQVRAHAQQRSPLGLRVLPLSRARGCQGVRAARARGARARDARAKGEQAKGE